MKTFILLCITCLIGTGAFLAALKMPDSLPGYALGFGVLLLFFVWFVKKSNRSSRRKQQERLFSEYLRSHQRNWNYSLGKLKSEFPDISWSVVFAVLLLVVLELFSVFQRCFACNGFKMSVKVRKVHKSTFVRNNGYA